MELESYFEPPTLKKKFTPSQQLPAVSYQIQKEKEKKKIGGRKRVRE